MPQDLIDQYIEEEMKRLKKLRILQLVIAAAILVIAAVCWFLFTGPLDSPAESRMKKLQDRAQSFALIANQWQERGNELESGVWQVNAAEGLPTYLLYYFEDSEGCWFGLKTDEDGQLVYMLYSVKEIPAEAIDTPPDRDAQLKLLSSHFMFRRRQAIGIWYADDSLNPTEPSENESTE